MSEIQSPLKALKREALKVKSFAPLHIQAPLVSFNALAF